MVLASRWWTTGPASNAGFGFRRPLCRDPSLGEASLGPLLALQRFHRRDVETPVGQSGRNVGAEPGVAGVEALVLLLHALALVLEIPAGRGFGGCRRIADAVAIVDGDRRAALVAKNLTLIVANDDQNIELRRRNGGLQPVHGVHGLLMAFPLSRGAGL